MPVTAFSLAGLMPTSTALAVLGLSVSLRVLIDKEIQEREVTLGGVSSVGEVEIRSGLNEGDIIVTTLP